MDIDIFGLENLRKEHAQQKVDNKKKYIKTIEEVNKQYPKIVEGLRRTLTTDVVKTINDKLHYTKTIEDEIRLPLNDSVSSYVQTYFDHEEDIDVDLFYKEIVSRLDSQFKIDANLTINGVLTHYYMKFEKICTNQICANTVLSLIVDDNIFTELKERRSELENNLLEKSDSITNLSDELLLNLKPWLTDRGFVKVEKTYSDNNPELLLKY